LSDDGDLAAPGWDAIHAALLPLYGSQEPLHYGVILSAQLGGQDYLQGISAYSVPQPQPHWHFVTYGFSELYDKESDDPAVSGFGFELTFRLAKGDVAQPPDWALGFLQNLGRYVFRTGNAFDPGHYLDLNGPIALGVDTDIRAIAFRDDDALLARDTPNGRLRFLQVVGITLDELEAIKRWKTARVLGLLLPRLPLGITDLSRRTTLDDPALRAELEAGIRAEGSSTGLLYTSVADWHAAEGRLEVVLGANAIRDVKGVLPGRIPYGRPLSILAGSRAIAFEPAADVRWSEERGGDTERLHVGLPAEVASELARVLEVRAGTYSLRAALGLSVRVEPSPIRNQAGDVVEVIG
jgi:hypothetical protein